MAMEEINGIVGDEQAGRAGQLVRALSGRSWSGVRGMFAEGCVRLNDAPCDDPAAEVRSGDAVCVRFDPHRRYHEPPRERPNSAFRMVFEDPSLIVVDKSASILTVPTERGETNTLLDAVTRHVQRRTSRSRTTVVHRLDRGTSGLLVFAKDPRVAEQLKSQFRIRKAEREYAAIVAGSLAPPEGTFSSRLATTKSLQRYSVPEGAPGEPAVTHYRVARPLREATYVRVRLETGRRNQIRVHFAEAGHPVLGDDRYGIERARHPAWKARRLALHAAVLGFDHPRTNKPLRFESPLPAEFEKFLSGQRP